ncbi:MAG TPA: PAS domain S-box protein [Lacipirellulaceae bacterium]|nr:PAS domain S-box protein [Lacipirellulaceae bacterium]
MTDADSPAVGSTAAAVGSDDHRNEAETLSDAACELAAELDLQSLLQKAADAGVRLTGASFGAFVLAGVDGEGAAHHLAAVSGTQGEGCDESCLSPSDELLRETFEGASVVRVDDLQERARRGRGPAPFGLRSNGPPLRSYLAAAVRRRTGELVGGLMLGHSEPGAFSQRAERMVRAIAAHAAVAIDNARLHAEAQHEIAERRKAADALRDSEHRYRLVVEAASDYIFDWDFEQGRVARAPGAQSLFGYTSEDITEDPAWGQDRVHPDDRERTLAGITAAREGRADLWRDEFRFRKANGEYAHVMARGHFVRDDQGRALRLIGSLTDLTEPKQMREALQSTERRYRQLVQRLPAAVYTCDAEGRIQLYNEAAVSLWGLSPEVGVARWSGALRMRRPDGELLPPEDSPMARALKSGQAIRAEEIIIERPDGAQRIVLSHPEPQRDAAGRVVGAVDMLLDVTERRQAELVQSQLAAIVESSDDAIVSKSLDGRIASWNLGAERIFGYTSAEAVGQNVLMLIPSDRQAEESELIARLRRGERIDHFETRRLTKDGRLIDVSLTVSPVLDSTGRVVGASKIARDVTRQKAYQQALRESNERFARFMQHLPGLAWIKDAEGRYVFANDAAERAFGMPRGEMYGRRDVELFAPETAEQFRANDEAALKGEAGVESIETLYQADGPHHSLVSKFPIPGPDGRPNMIGGIAIDVTERLHAERALRDSETRFRAITENAPVAMFIKDLDGRYTLANPLASQALGCPSGAEGRTDYELLPKEIADRLREIDMQVIRSGQAAEQEELVEGPGFRNEFLSVKFPMRDAEGQIIGVCGVAVDITERKRAQQALRESDQRLRLATQTGKLGVWDWDVENDRISWSESLYAIHGVSPEWFSETVGDFAQLVHPDDRELVSRSIQDAMHGDAPYELEFRAVRPDGETIWLFTNAIVLRRDGNPVRMLGATMDITERKRGEMALRDSEARFRALAGHAPVGIFRAEPNGDNVFVNDNWCELAGITAEQAYGRGWLQAVHPDDRATVEAGWDEAVRTGTPSAAEFRFQRPDGVITWLQGNAAPLRDGAGEVTGYIGTVADITQHKRAEEALRNSERMYRAIGESIDYGVWVCDAEGRNIYASESFLQLVGLTQEECSELGWTSVLHPDDVDQTIVAWQQCVQAGLPWDAEHRFRGVDGRWRPVLARGVPVRDDHGEITAWVGINLDISQLKQVENELRESEARFRTMADTAPVLIWINGVGGYQYVNREYLRFTGGRAEEVAGMRWIELIHPADREQYVQTYLQAFEKQAPFEAQVRMRRHDGEYRWLSCNGAPRLRPDGTFLGHVGVSVDVTDIKASEEALREADRRKDDFLAMLGHELRNPLAGIVTGAQVLNMLDLDGEAREMQGVIARQASHMSQIVDDLLDVSRIARGKLTLRHQHVNLGQLVRDAAEDYRRSHDLSPAELRFSVPMEEVWAWADPTRITQAITNIIHNSFKFSSGTNEIVVTMTTDPAGHVASIAVQDHGIGMTVETLNRIFEPFNQADTSLERSRGGLGLGLALAKGLIELHGGSVSAASDGIGRGSTFTITIPCEEEPGRPEASFKVAATRSRRVLIIDDRRDAILPLNRMLQIEGHEVATAMDGPAGIAKAEEFRPEVVLCDIGLAGDMNGYEVSRALRKMPQFADAYLVAVTGYGQEEDRRHAKEAGFDYHLTKPLAQAQVIDLMTRMPRF